MRTTKNISITLPPQLLKQATAIAKQEGRTQSELFREALRSYLVQSEYRTLVREGRKRTKAMGLKPSDVNRLIKEYRQEETKRSR
jgi:CopG family transcriptional regulator / antitoxin EndoAI